MTTEHAEDVKTFLEWVRKVRGTFKFNEDDPFQPWFRGQKDHWALCPKLYRSEFGGVRRLRQHKRKYHVTIEDEIREEFIVRAPVLSEISLLPDDDWGWYFLMQHHGVPTRLLDWTEAPLLALYFAVRDDHEFYDAAVWALDPYVLNEKEKKLKMKPGYGRVICPTATGTPAKDRELVRKWLPSRSEERANLPEGPIAVYPTHISRRISTQVSMFTIHGSDPKGLDRKASKDSPILRKIIIPSFKVQTLRKELGSYGIDDTLVFPDLDGLGRSLSAKWRVGSYKFPHEGTYTRLRRSTTDKDGVGVLAIKPIRKGAPIFPDDPEGFQSIPRKCLTNVSNDEYELYKHFCVYRKGEDNFLSPKSFNQLTISWYLNEPDHLGKANVRCDPRTLDFYALKDIAQGEELLVDYHSYSDDPPLKKPS